MIQPTIQRTIEPAIERAIERVGFGARDLTGTIHPVTDTARLLDPFRLPRHARPTRYDVTLEPDLAAAVFSGHVIIHVTIDDTDDNQFADQGELVLNAAELDVEQCVVDGEPAEHRLDDDTERLFIRPARDLVHGEHSVEIRFTGVLNDKLRGFYRSTFRDADGNEQVIATTQMQATDCRRAFPCWDEPDFKAVFGITLVVDPELLAVSNGPEVERHTVTTPAGEKVAVRFADTMLMSTYLAAFVVGPLEVTDPVDVGGIPLRVVHVPGKGHLTGFGLDVGAFCLRWFQDYYGIPYPSDKVDLLALPDFAAGAMENLGCITFRESLLLVDPATATQHEQEVVADVVAHELAHMWFGDLVTMGWWNGIWLNEAFATFMELAACDAYRPDWERWTTFGLERSAAFETDSLASTRSVEYEVRSPADCEGMFDVLTYQKGGALLRMLEQYLGAERFREGVSHYLRTNAYSNTDTSDLWDAIEVTSGAPVRRIMDSWIWQPGFPQITASLDGEQLVVRQSPFTFNSESESSTLWAVPITVRNADHVETLLLDGPEARLTLADPSAAVVVNAGGHAFFRVSYDDALRARLTGDALGSLDTLERYNLVDDAWNAVIAGHLPATDLLTFLEGFADEHEYAVWQAIVISLRGLGRLLDDAAFPRLQQRVARLVGPALADLGDPAADESDLVGKLRGLLTAALAVLGDDAATQARCRELYDRSEGEPGSVDPELVAAATSVVAATGGEAEYERMLVGFRSASTPQDQLRHLYALAEFDSAELIDRTCEFALGGEVKTQNAPFLLRMCIANRRHGPRAWTFVRKNWADINARFPSNTIIRMVDTVKTLNRPTDVADIQAFFSEHPIEQAAKTLEQTLERQRINAALREREQDALAAALS